MNPGLEPKVMTRDITKLLLLCQKKHKKNCKNQNNSPGALLNLQPNLVKKNFVESPDRRALNMPANIFKNKKTQFQTVPKHTRSKPYKHSTTRPTAVSSKSSPFPEAPGSGTSLELNMA